MKAILTETGFRVSTFVCLGFSLGEIVQQRYTLLPLSLSLCVVSCVVWLLIARKRRREVVP